MRKLFGWLAGLVTVAGLAKLFQRWRHSTPAPARTSEPDPAAELRRKLDDVRAGEPSAAPPGGAPGADAPAESEQPASIDSPGGQSIDERRAAIHAKAQEAIDAMRNPDA
jgi:hypothetical protein